jgi:hypothetical protein
VSLVASNIIPTYVRPKHTIGIGGFNAIQQGVHVVASAGNQGPDASSIRNAEPWLLTVAGRRHGLEGPADDTHDYVVGESLADRMKLLTLPPQDFKPLLYCTEEYRRYYQGRRHDSRLKGAKPANFCLGGAN